MIRRPPRSTRTDTLFPYTTLFRSGLAHRLHRRSGLRAVDAGREGACPVGPPLGLGAQLWPPADRLRSEEHTSELQSLMRISYAVFCLKKKKNKHTGTTIQRNTRSTNKYSTHPTQA